MGAVCCEGVKMVRYRGGGCHCEGRDGVLRAPSSGNGETFVSFPDDGMGAVCEVRRGRG
jgi:hypothetical protein